MSKERWAGPGDASVGSLRSGARGRGRRARRTTTYLGDEAVQSQLVLRQTLVQGAQLGQGVPQRGLLRPQLGHGQLECHAAGLCLQGWDQWPDSQAQRWGKRLEGHGDEE